MLEDFGPDGKAKQDVRVRRQADGADRHGPGDGGVYVRQAETLLRLPRTRRGPARRTSARASCSPASARRIRITRSTRSAGGRTATFTSTRAPHIKTDVETPLGPRHWHGGAASGSFGPIGGSGSGTLRSLDRRHQHLGTHVRSVGPVVLHHRLARRRAPHSCPIPPLNKRIIEAMMAPPLAADARRRRPALRRDLHQRPALPRRLARQSRLRQLRVAGLSTVTTSRRRARSSSASRWRAGDVEASRSSGPVDVQMGPDGALYVADWYDQVIQHNQIDFRDPRRDHSRGRIWRIVAKDRPLLPIPKLVGVSVAEHLLEQLKAAEPWTPATGEASSWPNAMRKKWDRRLESWMKSLDAKDKATSPDPSSRATVDGPDDRSVIDADLLSRVACIREEPKARAAARARRRRVGRAVAGSVSAPRDAGRRMPIRVFGWRRSWRQVGCRRRERWKSRSSRSTNRGIRSSSSR